MVVVSTSTSQIHQYQRNFTDINKFHLIVVAFDTRLWINKQNCKPHQEVRYDLSNKFHLISSLPPSIFDFVGSGGILGTPRPITALVLRQQSPILVYSSPYSWRVEIEMRTWLPTDRRLWFHDLKVFHPSILFNRKPRMSRFDFDSYRQPQSFGR